MWNAQQKTVERSRLSSFAFDAPQAEISATNEENGKI